MICTAWRTSAALFLLLDGIVGIELARVGAIVAGIVMAFAGSMLFLGVDRGALDLSRRMRKRLSDGRPETRAAGVVVPAE